MKGDEKLNIKDENEKHRETWWGGGTWVMHVDERMNATNLGNRQSIASPE